MHRAGLLLPSFIALLSACGGTSVGTGPGGQGPDPAGAGAGAAGAPTNPYPPPDGMYGGQGGTGGGFGGYAGGGPLEQPCPIDVPTQGTSCFDVGAMCTYATDCGENWALCGGSGWSVGSLLADGCGIGGDGGAGGFDGPGPIDPPPPPGPLSCPTATPQAGTPCYLPGNLASYECDYPGCPPVRATCNGSWGVVGDANGGCTGI
jgi:hypothetical protein